jgi:hypothetical protein
LIQISDTLNAQLPALAEGLGKANETGDLYAQAAAQDLLPLVEQAQVLGRRFDAVVANPPYMGSKAFSNGLKSWLKSAYPGNDKDLFSAFIARMLTLAKQRGYAGVMTSFVWMFIATFEKLRKIVVTEHTINSLVQLHYDAFEDAKAHVCCFVLQDQRVRGYKSAFVRLADFPGVENQGPKTLQAIKQRDCGWFYEAIQDEFVRIPGSPVAYWIRNAQPFDGPRIGDGFESGGRTKTHDNEKYLRFWWEVNRESNVWAPFANGGDFRKYAGNDLQVVDWSASATAFYESYGGLYPRKFWGKEGITWGLITSARVSFRVKRAEAHYSSGAPTIYNDSFSCDRVVLGFLNSPIAHTYLKAMNPTVNTTVNDVLGLPLSHRDQFPVIDSNVERLISLGKHDWDVFERSWDFLSPALLKVSATSKPTLQSSYTEWIEQNRANIGEMRRLEEDDNRIFINAYGLADELEPEVPIEQITLTVNPAYRYGGNLTEEEQRTRFRQDTMAELISYAIGCMMGRYSLDEPGLIYAHAGNVGFDPTRYPTFPADADGIVPITDEFWFEDDAASRVREFLRAVWGADTLDENMAWLAESLGAKASETPDETIRRYLADKFFKDHLQTYKKAPDLLAVLQRQTRRLPGPGLPAPLPRRHPRPPARRIRRAAHRQAAGPHRDAEKDAAATSSRQPATNSNKQREAAQEARRTARLRRKTPPLRRHAHQLDLDDGVKVNYGKFGDLLAEVKAVTGGTED